MLAKYRGTLIAPYWRFRPTEFYASVFVNGTYTADIMGCNWQCDHCWSAYGWQGILINGAPAANAGPRHELTPSKTADKLIEGMKRNAQSMCRISGGEPTMHWDHLVELIAVFLERTHDLRFHMPPVTPPAGDAMGIIIETNGSMLDRDRIDMLEERFGEEAQRIILSIGLKATHPEALSELTGLSLKVSERAHKRQLEALLYIALKCKHLRFWASFLDRYSDPGIYAALQRECERGRPGSARYFSLQHFKNYGDANRYWTPKKYRGGATPEASPERDEELITKFIDEDGSTASALEDIADLVQAHGETDDDEEREGLGEEIEELRAKLPAEEPQPVVRPAEGEDEMFDLQLEFVETVAKQGLPEGRFKEG